MEQESMNKTHATETHTKEGSMKTQSGGELLVYALEQIGVRFTFGIPGVHNTEVYDQLNKSDQILPILVTHEMGAGFMSDAVSRTSNSIGVAMVVPAAGVSHAMSAIGEAFLDGIPMLVITGGTRRDSGRHFQLHQLDQRLLVQAVTKAAFVIEKHEDIISTIYKAYDIATSGTPGPVLVEIPVELQLFQGNAPQKAPYRRQVSTPRIDPAKIEEAVQLLKNAKHPGIYVGYGARGAFEQLQELATLLNAPVATTLQGLPAFPANHPLHVGMGFGPSSVPAAENAFKNCDCLLTIGARFGELATGSYNLPVPKNHIHIDINADVFNKNYQAGVTIEADGREAVDLILASLRKSAFHSTVDGNALKTQIEKDKASYYQEWTKKSQDDQVSPGHFFNHLKTFMPDDSILTVDDGNHTFLTAELYPVRNAHGFISPTDFNAMGYAVPAAIGAKLINPTKVVASIVGDGAFLMTGLEILTASTNELGIVYFIFHDGELGQIAQLQKIPLNRKTCTIIGDVKIAGVAQATGAAFFEMNRDSEIKSVMEKAFSTAAQKNQPVIVDVKIDYSKKTRFTSGVVKANLSRFPLGEKVRFIGRAVKRHLLG